MTDFPSLTLAECADRILSCEKPLVVMHIRPDGDTVGSGAALCEIFKELGKQALYTCDDEIPPRLAFLTEGLVKAECFDGFDAVSIDVASPNQMGSLSDKIKVKLAIDHHAVNTPFAPNYTVPEASSAGEVLLGIARLLEERGLIRITERMAYLLYAAICSDTGGFAFSNTSAETFRAAADLISCGIDHAEINHKLFMSKSPEQMKAEGFVASRVKTEFSGKVAYAAVSKADMNELGVSDVHFDTAIDVVRSLLGVEIAFVAKETSRGIKVSLRSTGANVASVASKHGGGGHIRAAGCTVEAQDVDVAANIILSDIAEII